MAHQHAPAPRLRKTRIVCISDTHNQTPKLPKGDVLIHAGDLTNQGSYSELKKTVDWLNKTSFEAIIAIAGNHDITLDEDFYAKHGASWRWPQPQDPTRCRKLLEDSPRITYLENQAATVHLRSEKGPHTCFTVFGSPCTPKLRNWAFQYEAEEASKLWEAIPLDTDIVVTHTPPKNHCDCAEKDEQSGCPALLQALHRVRPMLSVFGHIHGARGVERVRWNVEAPETGHLEEGTELWKDAGAASNKQSLVDLTAKGGRPLDNLGALARPMKMPRFYVRELGGQPDDGDDAQPGILKSTSHAEDVANSEAEVMAVIISGGAYGQGGGNSDIGLASGPDVESAERRQHRRETVMINAALMSPHWERPRRSNKPIVVDVDLPVWSLIDECTH
ncbi:Metallo-dependent phosphatase [Pleomassaria siparia CBS 279.74]|uniref:Metallo-dependent phosphatase n=1 Tax=Pleomassaria siparia CBS 279.74 TaxID=1314801 RepID=A0A6G1K849_9PLEO|nr:Metallo-dependent phosphatase [Pleomassaria siparia CBS 279.74]